jgi:hypothetical protein
MPARTAWPLPQFCAWRSTTIGAATVRATSAVASVEPSSTTTIS